MAQSLELRVLTRLSDSGLISLENDSLIVGHPLVPFSSILENRYKISMGVEVGFPNLLLGVLEDYAKLSVYSTVLLYAAHQLEKLF